MSALPPKADIAERNSNVCFGPEAEVIGAETKPIGGKKNGIDPIAAARSLWLKTHPLPGTVGQVGSKLQNGPIWQTVLDEQADRDDPANCKND